MEREEGRIRYGCKYLVSTLNDRSLAQLVHLDCHNSFSKNTRNKLKIQDTYYSSILSNNVSKPQAFHTIWRVTKQLQLVDIADSIDLEWALIS